MYALFSTTIAKTVGFVIMSSYGQKQKHLYSWTFKYATELHGGKTNGGTNISKKYIGEPKRTVQNSTRMQMNASFCRELDPSKFHSSLEIPDPTIFPTFNTVSGKLCKSLLRLASCHFKLHVSLVQKTKQSKYSVQTSFLYFICEYFL